LTEHLEAGQAAPIDPDIQAYVDRVVAALEEELGAGLVGVYVHGSLAMGAFVPGRSDIDVLAVCGEPLSSQHSRALGAALDAIPRPRSGGDLEFSLVTEAEARKPSAKPAFEVHVSTHEEDSVVDGHDRPGDEDLVIHFAMARARGRALLGPEPNDLFPEPDRPSLLRAFLSDLEWARRHGAAGWEGHDMPDLTSIAYRVLNAARSWRYLKTGELGSKVEGATWLGRADPGPNVPELLGAVLAFQRGEAPRRPEGRMVESFVDNVEAMLRREIGGGG
jgi:predicted nucleotidyltransferase